MCPGECIDGLVYLFDEAVRVPCLDIHTIFESGGEHGSSSWRNGTCEEVDCRGWTAATDGWVWDEQCVSVHIDQYQHNQFPERGWGVLIVVQGYMGRVDPWDDGIKDLRVARCVALTRAVEQMPDAMLED